MTENAQYHPNLLGKMPVAPMKKCFLLSHLKQLLMADLIHYPTHPMARAARVQLQDLAVPLGLGASLERDSRGPGTGAVDMLLILASGVLTANSMTFMPSIYFGNGGGSTAAFAQLVPAFCEPEAQDQCKIGYQVARQQDLLLEQWIVAVLGNVVRSLDHIVQAIIAEPDHGGCPLQPETSIL
ncbi:hypothetical protein FB45DRAFT_875885 [Roridomyces roridus]|uniref:Uncharacterized protein n=1 Tax=Roridomyces roridus TaxID=1738132 RepID=A0AAD7FB80_9AGAR|nr:hypothetical protein FB45DRAFT_875885 [Roridomyces roridus]